jgi:hypothetical protein
VVLDRRLDPQEHKFWVWSFDKRPEEELYFLPEDPGCIHNLAGDEMFATLKGQLKEQLFKALEQQNDPRMSGNGDIFDQYKYADTKHQNFYEKYMRGEDLEAGWVNASDFRTVKAQ